MTDPAAGVPSTARALRELEAHGVYDPGAPEAAQRLELLEYFLEGGATVEEIVLAFRENRVDTINSYRFLRGDEPWVDAATIATRSNSTVERVERMAAALGLPADPGEAVYAPELVACARAFETGLRIFGEDATLQFIRVMGASLAGIAEAGIGLFVHEIVEADEPVTELERARAGEEAVVAAMLIPDIVAATWRSVFLQANDRDIAVRRETETGMALDVAVGFVDLVGYTALSERLTMPQVAEALGRFEARAWELAAAHGARVTKHVGDEVMLVGPDPIGVVSAALGLCAMADEDPALDAARGAVTFGLVHHRVGDYFGPLVNLAARAVPVAKPGTVVVPAEVVHRLSLAARGRIDTVPLGAFDLRGFELPVELWEARAVIG